MQKLKRATSILLLLVMLIGLFPALNISILPIPEVEAASANLMASKMMQFLKEQNAPSDMAEMSTDEMRIYAVFLSNFSFPLETKVSDFNAEGPLADTIAQIFGVDAAEAAKLNNLIYTAIKNSVKQGKLVPVSDSAYKENETYIGEYIYRAMAKKSNVKLGWKDSTGNVNQVFDFRNQAVQAAWKVLASYSVDFFMSEDGFIDILNLYIDCFGNIWASKKETNEYLGISFNDESEVDALTLIMPACLNPVSFFNHNGVSSTTYDANGGLAGLKVPLNNSFALGAFINPDFINTSGKVGSNTINANYVALLNVSSDLFTQRDQAKNLVIYGLNTPFKSTFNSDYLYLANDGNGYTLDDMTNELTSFSTRKANQLTNTKIVFQTNVKSMEEYAGKRINEVFDKIDKRGSSVPEWERKNFLDYLYGTLVIDYDYATFNDVMYHFGTGYDTSDSWAVTDFSELGIVGLNLFTSQTVTSKDSDTGVVTSDSYILGNYATTKLAGSVYKLYNTEGIKKLEGSTTMKVVDSYEVSTYATAIADFNFNPFNNSAAVLYAKVTKTKEKDRMKELDTKLYEDVEARINLVPFILAVDMQYLKNQGVADSDILSGIIVEKDNAKIGSVAIGELLKPYLMDKKETENVESAYKRTVKRDSESIWNATSALMNTTLGSTTIRVSKATAGIMNLLGAIYHIDNGEEVEDTWVVSRGKKGGSLPAYFNGYRGSDNQGTSGGEHIMGLKDYVTMDSNGNYFSLWLDTIGGKSLLFNGVATYTDSYVYGKLNFNMDSWDGKVTSGFNWYRDFGDAFMTPDGALHYDDWMYYNIDYSYYGYSTYTRANDNIYKGKVFYDIAYFYSQHMYTIFTALEPLQIDTNSADLQWVLGSGAGESTATFKRSNYRLGTGNNWPGIYMGYMVEILRLKESKTTDAEGNPTFNITSFRTTKMPPMPDGISKGGSMSFTDSLSESGVSSSEKSELENMQKDIVKKMYGILSTDYNEYRESWIQRILNGFILKTHRAITGSWAGAIGNVTTGSASSYSSIVGYINMPSLYELPFTNWLMTNYMQIYTIVLILILFIMIIMVVLNLRGVKQGLITIAIMSVVLLMPNILIENTINITNAITNSIYSDRFDFWAMVNHMTSYEKLQGSGALEGDKTPEALVANTADKVQNIYSDDPSVRLKWMAPKKSGVFANIYSHPGMTEGFATNLKIFQWLFSSFVYEQEYVYSDPMATYLYRPYNTVANEAIRYNIGAKAKLLTIGSKSASITVNNNSITVPSVVATLNVNQNKTDISKRKSDGLFDALYYDSGLNYTSEYVWKDSLGIERLRTPASRQIDLRKISYKGASTTITSADSVKYWGLGSTAINKLIFDTGSIPDVKTPVDLSLANIPSDETLQNASADAVQLYAFFKNTESPFYYFYNVFSMRYAENGGFKQALLANDMFKVNGYETADGDYINNAVRDYLGLGDLFTTIIPYMTLANQYVYEWTDIHGLDIPDYNFANDDGSELSGDKSESYLRQKAYKENMEKVWSLYAPWVDQLNSLPVYNKNIKIAGSARKVGNTLNPSSYIEVGRTMIFSEAEMKLRGYKVSDLSDIEIRIQKVLEDTMLDMQYLVNYYDFEDEVLMTAAAMYATFNFNSVFSQNSILGEDINLYPQSFEMKNFNYDAFMRMIMLNATGESVFAQGDLYETILNKTSFFTGILIILVDLCAVILIPMMKILILILTLFLGILICLTCVINPPDKLLQSIGKSVFLPTLLFMGFNILFAGLIALLVGNGLTGYVGERVASIATNDPTLTLALLLLISVVYVYCLFRVIKLLYNSYKDYGLNTITTALGIVTAGVGAIGAVASKGMKRVGNASLGAMLAGKGNRLRGAADGFTNGNAIGEHLRSQRNAQAMQNALGNGTEIPGGRNIKNSIDTKASNASNGSVNGASSSAANGSVNGASNVKLPDSMYDDKGKPIIGAGGAIPTGSDKSKDNPNATAMGNALVKAGNATFAIRDGINKAQHNAADATTKVKTKLNGGVDPKLKRGTAEYDAARATYLKNRVDSKLAKQNQRLDTKGDALLDSKAQKEGNIKKESYLSQSIKQAKINSAKNARTLASNDRKRSVDRGSRDASDTSHTALDKKASLAVVSARQHVDKTKATYEGKKQANYDKFSDGVDKIEAKRAASKQKAMEAKQKIAASTIAKTINRT